QRPPGTTIDIHWHGEIRYQQTQLARRIEDRDVVRLRFQGEKFAVLPCRIGRDAGQIETKPLGGRLKEKQPLRASVQSECRGLAVNFCMNQKSFPRRVHARLVICEARKRRSKSRARGERKQKQKRKNFL